MILKKGTIADVAQRVQNSGLGIILYGAGVIGEIVAPYWLYKYSLEDAVFCYVDMDIHKQGKTIQIGAREVPVKPLTALKEWQGRYILLVTVSAFEPVVRFVDALSGMENVEAYFLPIMLLDIAHAPKGEGIIRTSEAPLIPKKIHYCWFSGNPIPEPLQKCIASWKRFCPDYEIIRWDESNYDVDKNLYTRQAYGQKKWSFVADFARLDILYHNGGIYLDTDVELLRNLDGFLYQPGFCGAEKWGFANTGGGIGACPQNSVVKSMLDYRQNAVFLREDGTLNLTTCGYFETFPLIAQGFEPNGKTQVTCGGEMTVYASEFFQPFDYMSGETHLTSNTYSIHYFSGTWLGREAALEKKQTREKFKKFASRLE